MSPFATATEDARPGPAARVEYETQRASDDDGACVCDLQRVWAVTGFDDAVRLTAGLGRSALERLLEHERETSDRPRYRRMLRRRLDDLRRVDR